MDIEIKKLNVQNVDDFSALIKIFEVVFERENLNTPDKKYLESLLSKPDFLVLIAKCNNKVIGGLTVYILHSYYSAKPTAYIYDVGVMNDYQRKGIGKQLISFLTRFCKENGFEDAYVQAETNDILAVNFYKSTGTSSVLQATQFTYTFKKANV